MPDRTSLILMITAVIASFMDYLVPSQISKTKQSVEIKTIESISPDVAEKKTPESKEGTPQFEILGQVPATLAADKDGKYLVEVVLRRNGATNFSPVWVVAEWKSSNPKSNRMAGWANGAGPWTGSVRLPAGTLMPTLVALGSSLKPGESGYLRFVACLMSYQMPQPLLSTAAIALNSKLCSSSDHPVALLEVPPVPKPLQSAVFYYPLLLAALSTIAGLVILLSGSKVAWNTSVAKMGWNIGDSFAANLNFGTVLVNAILSIGLSFGGIGPIYSKDEFMAWSVIFGLSTGLATAIFGLLKTLDGNGKPTGSLPGFLFANLFNLFGVFGQLLLAYQLMRLLGEAKLITTAANPLSALPIILGVSVFWYVGVSFLALRKAPSSDLALGSTVERNWPLL